MMGEILNEVIKGVNEGWMVIGWVSGRSILFGRRRVD
jgi:hypothetical protein